jgi:antitoxin component of MazEF toxin-antitoxin module
MRARLVPIGSARGIRIPEEILAQCNMTDAVELTIEGQQIVLSPFGAQPRTGWRDAAKRMAATDDDALLIPDVFEGDANVEWK